MAGGGSRRDDAPLKIRSTNGFAVLESLKKKKKSDSKSRSSSSSSSKGQAKEKAPEVYYQPKPLVHRSWADVEDDEDDDYLETTEPLETIWGAAGTSRKKEIEAVIQEEVVEESESEDGLDDDDDVDIEEEHGQEIVDPIPGEPLEKRTPSVSSAPKDTDRQLSKKELKKKGIEELDAILAELGITGNNDRGQEQSTEERKVNEENGNGGKKENEPVATESKSSKKKKAKKDKSSKEAKVSQEEQQLNGSHTSPDDANNIEEAPVVDVKERLKKAVVSVKKKKNHPRKWLRLPKLLRRRLQQEMLDWLLQRRKRRTTIISNLFGKLRSFKGLQSCPLRSISLVLLSNAK
ncbi:uncharacterized protein M6B38_292805 [Iris pallida]|uniref:Uncharacterized protein n=1 Tax=Iris pallida TaxID=29817 RepID=A0AAX6HUT4_IRIPA|nr:uncharacterized protein M6B38_292805 [Iris pallida]